MHLVRLGVEPTEVGADVRAAIAAWGSGRSVLGGVTVFGCRPPGSPRELDAVIVLPRGLIVVLGVDLPEPALKLEAPAGTPWTVDGWPLVRTEGAVNPAQEGLESAAALARSLQSRGLEPLPVAAVVAVGPYVGQVTQPTTDLHRGVRVVSPNTTSVLSAARELATYESTCDAGSAKALLDVLGAEVTGEVLVGEGFPEAPEVDLAGADTMLIPKYSEKRPAGRARTSARSRSFPRGKLIGAVAALVVVFGLLGALALGSTWAGPPEVATQRVDGVGFAHRATDHVAACGQHSYGDVQRWFQVQPCRSLRRGLFETHRGESAVALSVAVVDLPGQEAATQLRKLLESAGTGGISDLVSQGRGWSGGPRDFGDAAQAVQQHGSQVRVVQAVWAREPSHPDDLELRAMAERGLRLHP
ncbi:hypothetical protein EIL87_03825 [Saccharopolyspora rhizosphaerae]|uniref:Uncharacterized protein n=1 Tax=Saccharopolyspora rhizosphaerae TaxID=2492662 RepID=A0A426K1E5_9PSEU|nr:hypothetical protein [Saccharopolyspora rhizosphaerae]RRO19252.1 hypothetical protein EIL87_03825 [Saccharopolyspora rhizosphaerae]